MEKLPAILILPCLIAWSTASGGPQTQTAQKAGLDDLAWMAGSWAGDEGGTRARALPGPAPPGHRRELTDWP